MPGMRRLSEVFVIGWKKRQYSGSLSRRAEFLMQAAGQEIIRWRLQGAVQRLWGLIRHLIWRCLQREREMKRGWNLVLLLGKRRKCRSREMYLMAFRDYSALFHIK